MLQVANNTAEFLNETVNGWSNEETWDLVTIIENDHGLYDAINHYTRFERDSHQLKWFCTELRLAGWFRDITATEWMNISWCEVADYYNS
jgi:hypothetical protein